MDFAVMKDYLPRFWDALLLTLKIGWQGVLLALVLGVACAVVVHLKIPVLRRIVGAYIELFRNTPLLVQLFFLYFGLPKLGIVLSAESCAIVGLAFLGGSYMAEALRSGLESIEKSQIESAQSLGMGKLLTMQEVILPQALAVSVPGICANMIFLIKETSVLSYVGVVEILRKGALWNAASFNTFEAYVGVALVYMVLTIPTSKLVKFMEKKMATESK